MIHEIVDPKLKGVVLNLNIDAKQLLEKITYLMLEFSLEPFHDEDECSHKDYDVHLCDQAVRSNDQP
jgi:hypothetical protein